MTEAEAQARLERMTANTVEPTLDAAEITDLLSMSRLCDAAGLAPTATGWAPTFDLSRGAAEGWRWKAAKVSPSFTFSTDGQQFTRSQIYDHCIAQAAEYAKKIHSSIPVPGVLARFDGANY